jgi:hypothetical protein
MRRQVSRVSRRAKHEATRDQVIEQARVPVMVYRGSSGCRVIDLFHKLA